MLGRWSKGLVALMGQVAWRKAARLCFLGSLAVAVFLRPKTPWLTEGAGWWIDLLFGTACVWAALMGLLIFQVLIFWLYEQAVMWDLARGQRSVVTGEDVSGV